MMQEQPEHSRSVGYAQEYLASLDLPTPTKPEGDAPEWPRHLGEVADSALADHMAYWTAMLSYIGDHVAIADAERKVFEMQEESLVAQGTLTNIAKAHERIRMRENDGENVTATEKSTLTSYTFHRTKALMSDEVQKTRALYLKYYTLWKLLSVRMRDYEQNYATISREIARREQMRRAEGRGS